MRSLKNKLLNITTTENPAFLIENSWLPSGTRTGGGTK